MFLCASTWLGAPTRPPSNGDATAKTWCSIPFDASLTNQSIGNSSSNESQEKTRKRNTAEHGTDEFSSGTRDGSWWGRQAAPTRILEQELEDSCTRGCDSLKKGWESTLQQASRLGHHGVRANLNGTWAWSIPKKASNAQASPQGGKQPKTQKTHRGGGVNKKTPHPSNKAKAAGQRPIRPTPSHARDFIESYNNPRDLRFSRANQLP